MDRATSKIDVKLTYNLNFQEAVKQLGSILKTNVRACKALGHPFVAQLGRIYLDMLNVYKVTSVVFNVYSNFIGYLSKFTNETQHEHEFKVVNKDKYAEVQ